MPPLATEHAREPNWAQFGASALAALGMLAVMPRSLARDHLQMPALRLGRALGLPASLVSYWRSGGVSGDDEIGQEDNRERLISEARAAIERFGQSSTPAQRREAVAALRALERQMQAEERRVQQRAQREPAQRPLADQIIDNLRRTRELLREAAATVSAGASAFDPSPGGGLFAGLGIGALLAIGLGAVLLLKGKL